MARCSCGGIIKQIAMKVEDDTRHGETVLKQVGYCPDCGRQYGAAQPIVKTSPSKEERAEAH